MIRYIMLLSLLVPVSLAAQQDPRIMPKLGTVDPRFQSYNVEMTEVTGGRFWKPYSTLPTGEAVPTKGGSPFEQRSAVDLYNPRLRRLAAALGPVYLRVSGSGANTVFFQNSEAPPPATPPPGYNSVLTQPEWKGVVDFAKSVNAKIITSFAIGDGVRDASGVWSTKQAASFLLYDRSLGGNIVGAEFVNEPTFITISGFPKNYNADAYGRDFAIFSTFYRKELPHALLLGPSAVGEGSGPPPMPVLPAKSLLRASRQVPVDVFTYHFYGAASQRCSAMLGPDVLTSPDLAMSESWLNLTSQAESFYAELRDQFAPGKPIWLSESGQAGCGGDSWASTFLDTFRYLGQLGQLAQRGVQVVIHNTLNASDYGLIDQVTLAPRPNYWAALLWHDTMGTTVLKPANIDMPSVHFYAHCMKGQGGGVTLLALNTDPAIPRAFSVPQKSMRWTLTSGGLLSREALLNGRPIELTQSGNVPRLAGVVAAAGIVELPPASITFLTFSAAHNAACMR